jgi:LacI family transcriptional regulator
MRNTTLKDVAREAGVSVSTASLVLNRKGQISQDVRDRVQAAARKLDYIKTLSVPSATRKYLGRLAVLVFEDAEKGFIWNFFRSIIVPLEQTLVKHQLYPVIVPVSSHHDTADILEKLLVAKPTGVFSIDYGNQQLFQRLEDQGIPVIVVNNTSFQTRFQTVCVDDFHGAYEGTRYLIELGHTRIVYAEYHRPDMPALLNDRFIGFKKALDEEQLCFSGDCRVTINLFNLEELQQKLRTIFAAPSPPTALFAHDDFLAARILTVVQAMGLRVPEDVSLIAPGDVLDYSQPFIPQITTMQINTELMGKLAADMLVQRLQQPRQAVHVLKVNQQLQVRGSCRRRVHTEYH